MADPAGPIPVREPKRGKAFAGEARVMNGFFEISAAVSLVLLAAFLVAGVALPFVSTQRKVRR